MTQLVDSSWTAPYKLGVCRLVSCLPWSASCCDSRAQTQEAPSFLVPAGLVAAELAHPARGAAPALALCPSTALLGCFMAHYFHRAFVYPLVVQRGGKPTPAPVWLMALAFCTYNGLMQVLAHAGALLHVPRVRSCVFPWTGQREAQTRLQAWPVHPCSRVIQALFAAMPYLQPLLILLNPWLRVSFIDSPVRPHRACTCCTCTLEGARMHCSGSVWRCGRWAGTSTFTPITCCAA